jgi:hypothetical protein
MTTDIVKNLLKSIQKLVNNSQIIEYNEAIDAIQTYDMKTDTRYSIPLHNLDNQQKIKVLSLVHNHNVEFVKFISNVMKQQIEKLKSGG